MNKNHNWILLAIFQKLTNVLHIRTYPRATRPVYFVHPKRRTFEPVRAERRGEVRDANGPSVVIDVPVQLNLVEVGVAHEYSGNGRLESTVD
jgi:hypothetical protein